MNKIQVTKLKEWLNQKQELQLVDVREREEFEICNLGGEWIPMVEVPNQIDRIKRDVPVVVYCHHGERSAMVINYLADKHGFDNLYNLEGGVHAWAELIDPEMPTY